MYWHYWVFFSSLQKLVMINCFPVDGASSPSPLQSILKKTSPLAKWQETAHTLKILSSLLFNGKEIRLFIIIFFVLSAWWQLLFLSFFFLSRCLSFGNISVKKTKQQKKTVGFKNPYMGTKKMFLLKSNISLGHIVKEKPCEMLTCSHISALTVSVETRQCPYVTCSYLQGRVLMR